MKLLAEAQTKLKNTPNDIELKKTVDIYMNELKLLEDTTDNISFRFK